MKKLLVYGLLSTYLFSGDITGREIINKMVSPDGVMTSKMEIKLINTDIKRGKEKTTVREMTRFHKKYINGTYASKSLLRFSKPDIIKGTGFLIWANSSGINDQWLFLPRVKTARKIEAQEKTKSFMNTEFSYEDLESFNKPDEQYFLDDEEILNGLHCYIVEVISHSSTQYKYRLAWIDSQDWLLRKVEFYDKNNKLYKTLYVEDYFQSNSYNFAKKMIMKNEQTFSSTVMEMSDIKYNIEIPDSHFTKDSLVNP
jgi:outer membrane lipoprotein-sorting protein